MKTKHFLSKKITYSLFGPRYYHAIKSKKILFDYLVGKDYEHIYDVLIKILSKDDIILDIGANMGQYLSRLSRFVKEGKIICIEPIPQNVVALNYLKKKLKITNSTIIAKAISNTSGLAKMTIPKLDGVPISTQATLLNVLSS